jgi:hypothetical protein
VVGAVAVAFALAFGLGGRETAAKVVRKWYDQAQASAPKIEGAADRAESKAAWATKQLSDKRGS